MQMINSKNRTPAKRLLNNFIDSREVRMMTMQQLNDALIRVINQGLITNEGAMRALGINSRDENESHHDDRSRGGMKNNGEQDERDSEMQSHNNDGNGNSEGDGESEGGNDSSSNQNDSESGDGDGDGEQSEDGDEDGNGESDAGTESEDGEGESEDDGKGEGQSEDDGDQSDGEQSEDGSENESESNSEGEQQQQQQDNEDELRCECCSKVCTQDELCAGAEGTDREGEALCAECDKANNETHEDIPLRHKAFASILKWISAGVNVALVGPAGSGKSTIVEHVCEELQKEFRGCGALMSKYDLIGFVDANGTYHATPLYEAFNEGHLFCFDEFDASAPDAGVSFNAATDKQKFFTFPNGQKPKHEDFVAVCCMNTWGNGATADYVGRFKQDAASMSRFVKVHVDYDRKIEARIAGKANLDIAQRVWDLRDACEALGIRHVCSTRMIEQAVAGRSVKCTKTEIDRDVLFAGLDDGATRQLKSKMRELANERGQS